MKIFGNNGQNINFKTHAFILEMIGRTNSTKIIEKLSNLIAVADAGD